MATSKIQALVDLVYCMKLKMSFVRMSINNGNMVGIRTDVRSLLFDYREISSKLNQTAADLYLPFDVES